MGANCWLEMESFPARQRFHVECEQGSMEVSWSKLLKLVPAANTTTTTTVNGNAGDPVAKHGLENRIAPEMPAAHKDGRMNAVIEKIERLYQGHSEHEENEENDEEECHDDLTGTSCKPTEEDYDTEDTFIDDEELDAYFEVNRIKTKHSGFYINKGTLEKKAIEGKNLDEVSGIKVYKKRKRLPQERQPVLKKAKSDDEMTTPSTKTVKTTTIKAKSCASKGPLAERNLSIFADTTTAKINNVDDMKTPLKESSPGRKTAPKLTILDRAIQDLEKEVFDRCPPSTEKNHETENKKRIPKEVKTRLAKVARLAQKQNKLVSDELVDALMKIMGHLMQLRTLKKNLKDMAELGLSAQKEKQSKLEAVKDEIVEMVKARINPQESAQDKSEENGEQRYTWDVATENRISDLYELYVEGIDEHKSAATKKFYAELAELWPEGWMDSNGIKNAVLRAKERKRGAIKQAKVEERKRKNTTAKVGKKTASPPPEPRQLEHEHEHDEVDVVGSCSVDASVTAATASSAALRRDCPVVRNGAVTPLPSSLRQIKRKLQDKTSNRSFLQSESYCCNTDKITCPSSLVWVVKDPKPG